MPRDIPVGNGKFLVTFDQGYRLRDIYFPAVGMENHSDGHKFRFGIWVDGTFSWIDSDWDLDIRYAGSSLLTLVTADSKALGIRLICNDLVDHEENMYIKKVQIENFEEREREFRLFFHHDFNIYESVTGDTAYYDPDEKAVIHYKKNRYFLMSGMRGNLPGIDRYAIGIKEFKGLEGTWRDAEDGILEGNPIAQGSVDSTIAFTVTVPPQSKENITYWICAGEDFADVSRLNKMIHGHGLDHFTSRTVNYWQAWVNKEQLDFEDLPATIAELYKKSLLILCTNIDSGGAIIAGNDSDIRAFSRDSYSYMWPRDGALTAYALDLAGYEGISRRFFNFCLKIISRGKESIGGYFLHKYNPDGSLGSSWHPWITDGQNILPIQEDGTALLIWSLWSHFKKFKDVEFAVSQYEKLVIRCADFIAGYRDDVTGLPLPSYDLWEEKWGIHTFTVSAVYAGLKAAENFAEYFGETRRKRIYARAAAEVKDSLDRYLFSKDHNRFLKLIIPEADGTFSPDLAVDASIYAPFYFGVFEPDDARISGTMNTVREKLWIKTDVGGIARYENDSYMIDQGNVGKVPGNPWFICTLWLAQWHIAKAATLRELAEAAAIFDWVADKALPSGVLAEQVHPFTKQPLSVAPLTWSHATFIAAVHEYLDKYQKLKSQEESHDESRR